MQRINGQSLVSITIGHAKQCPEVDHVLVSTEDSEIQREALRNGAETHGRIDAFIHDNSIQEVDRLLRWTVLQLEASGARIDIILLLYPTAPLRDVTAVSRAARMVRDDGFDSVLSLTESFDYLWRIQNDTAKPVNYDPKTRGPRQKEAWNQWVENKAVYAMRRDLLVETGCRLGGHIGYVTMSRLQSIDVDTPEDLILCRALHAVTRTEEARANG